MSDKLDKIRDEENENRFPLLHWTSNSVSNRNRKRLGFNEGFQFAISLELPVKFAEWLGKNYDMDVDGLWTGKTTQDLFDYWLENIYTP